MLVAGLAHDLRSPLSAASAGMQLLARTPCDQTRHMEFTARALQNIQRADRMLSDLLDASRVEAGERLPVRMEQCDLASVAWEVAAELATVHGDRFVVKPPTPVTGYWDC